MGTGPLDVRWTGRAAAADDAAGLLPSAPRLFFRLGSRSIIPAVRSDEREFFVPRLVPRLLGRYARAPSTALPADDRPPRFPAPVPADESAGGTRTFSYRPRRTPETSYDGGRASGRGRAAALVRRPFGLEDALGPAAPVGFLGAADPEPPPFALPDDEPDLLLLPPVRPLPLLAVVDDVTLPEKLSGGPASRALPCLFPSASRTGIGA